MDDLMPLIQQIVPFHMRHNAEPEACDLCIELERLDLLHPHVDATNAGRTALYLLSCAAYLPDPEDAAVLRAAHSIYVAVRRLPEALRCALKLGTHTPMGQELVTATWTAAAGDTALKRQLAHMLSGLGLVLPAHPDCLDDDADSEALKDIFANAKKSERYLTLARDLDVMEPRTPEDIYKSHLTEGRAPAGAAAVDSARANLASTFVNAFVNAGFGVDKLLTQGPDGGNEAAGSNEVSWIYKNKDHGKTAAAASLGTILLWDVDGGLPVVDKYVYATDQSVVAGALLAIGLLNCGVRNEMDPAYALLCDSAGKRETPEVQCAALLGLGLAYAGCARAEVRDLVSPILGDESYAMDTVAYGALALGLTFCGTCDGACAEALLTCLMTRGEMDLGMPLTKLVVLGLGLLFLGRGPAVEATVEVAKTLNPRLQRFACVVLDACAYAGTGNVLKVQHMLALVGERVEDDAAVGEGGDTGATARAENAQAAAVIGIALIAMGEDIGVDMAQRAMDRILQYGEPGVRRGVPLALALLSTSRPDLAVTDCLGRLAHDPHEGVSTAACIALGIAAAGTNNARVANQLRQLSSYYYKEPGALFMVRVAQGLVHLGKGLLTLNPMQCERSCVRLPALAGLAVVAFACLDAKDTVLSKHACLLYCIVPAMQPRMLMTISCDDGAPVPVPVRVGEAIDTVAQAGRPKTITGFQTHTTPVLLATGERAELGTEQYLPLSPILEGVVLLKPNPDWEGNDGKD